VNASPAAPDPGTLALQLSGVQKSFGSTLIIRGVSFDVRRG
jgi:ABC-type transporter Mla maintaining outer membrane lipid asymmetry ATPase subunit MlaF